MSKIILSAGLLLALLFLPSAARAAPELITPLDCRLGENCWQGRYVDTNPKAGELQDFTCGAATDDGHEGTDFVIRDQVAMEQGVTVRAAADGRILHVRNDSEDKVATAEEIEKLTAEKKTCGNGVLIDHSDGWQTIYCHMKKDSILVRKDQEVKAGDALGQVGQSGIAGYPHLHFSVFFENRTIDPFTGAQADKGCRVTPHTPLWKADAGLSHVPVTLFAGGFLKGKPNFEQIKIDGSTPAAINASASALTFWVGALNVMADDRIRLEITGPNGQVFAAQDITQDKNTARQYYFVGRKTESGLLPAGAYKGTITFQRAGSDGTVLTRTLEKTVTVR